MKMYYLGLACVLMGSWSDVCAMELQMEQEIAVARARTLLELGKILVESNEYEKAREYLEEAANQGTDKTSAVAAKIQLGELYYGGFGVEIDYEKAHECYMQAANQKEDIQALVVACQYLGEMYLLGRGVEKDYQQARVYFQLLDNAQIKEAGFSVTRVALKHWRLLEPHLERVNVLTHDGVQAATLRKEIIAEYGKLDATSITELIRALDYANITLLLEIACDEVKKSNLGRFSFEQINSLPGDMGNRIMLDKILAICGPEFAVGRGHEGSVSSVCVTEDGKIVSGSDDKTVRVWDMDGNQLVECRGHQGEVTSVGVTKDGKIVSGSWDQTLKVWDMEGTQLAVCRGHEDWVTSICVTSDGKILSGSRDKTIRVWNLQGKELAICRGHGDQVDSVCVTNDGKIVSGSCDHTVRVWDMQGKELAKCGGRKRMVTSLCVTNDGRIVSGSDDYTVCIWGVQRKELAICRGHQGTVESVCVAKDGKIVSGSRDRTIRVWDMQGKERAICRGHKDDVLAVCITADGKIVSGSKDKTVRVWDMGLLCRVIRMDQDQARALWKLLHSVVFMEDKIDKQELWKEVEKILGENCSSGTSQN